MRPSFFVTTLGTAVLALTTGSLEGQTPTASLSGTVRDSAGDPLPGTTVTAIGVRTGYEYSTLTDEEGRFWLGRLPSGGYEVGAQRVGFETVVHPNVDLSVGQELTAEFLLIRRPIELPPVEVDRRRPPLQTTRADITSWMDRHQIEDLPEETRDFLQIAQLAPGATRFYDTGEPVAPTAVGALSPYFVGVLVDGASLIGSENAELLTDVPLSAIDGFEVITAGYSAEYGQASSGVVSLATRRGSNSLEAEAFFRYRDRALNSLGTFEDVKPDFDRSHWGLSLGGPLYRDQTQVFAAFERRVENNFATVETGGLFPGLEGTFHLPRSANLMFTRLDHRFDESHELAVRYLGGHREALTDVGTSSTCGIVSGGSLGSRAYGADVEGTGHSLLAVHRWSARQGRVINEARASYNHRTENRIPTRDVPTLGFPTICDGGNAFRWSQSSSRLEIRDDLVVALTSAHRLKTGVLFGLVDVDSPTGNFTNGAFKFAEDSSSAPSQLQLALEGIGTTRTSQQFGVYVEDDWAVAPKFSLSLGLRYDIETNSTNQGFLAPEAGAIPFVATSERPVDANNLAPRVSFAWDPGGEGRSVLRGGLGVFYNQLSLAFGGLEASRNRIVLIPEPGTTDLESIPIDPDAALVFPTFLGERFSTPFTRQASLGFGHAVTDDVIFSIDGLLVQGRNLPTYRQLNSIVGFDANGPVFRFPGFLLFQLLNEGTADAAMLILRARRQTAGAWFDVSYTLADRRVTSDAWFDIVPQSDPYSRDFSSESGPAAWDERHRLVVLGSLTSRGGTGTAVKAVYASGRPFNVLTGTDDNGDFFTNDRPGSVRRNSERGPDYFAMDLSFFQRLQIGRAQFEARINIYNLTNRDNYLPESVVQNSRSDLFGRPLAAAEKRQMELAIAARL